MNYTAHSIDAYIAKQRETANSFLAYMAKNRNRVPNNEPESPRNNSDTIDILLSPYQNTVIH